MYEVDFDLSIHVRSTVWLDDEPSSIDDLLDYIFPDGWEGENLGVTGDMDVTSEEEE